MKFKAKGKNLKNLESLIYKIGRKRINVYADKKEYIPDDETYIGVWKGTYRMNNGTKEYIEIDPEWEIKGFTLKEGTQAEIIILE